MKLFNGFFTLALVILCSGKGDSQIIEGLTAPDHNYPYMAAVGLGYRDVNNQFISTSSCGGAIIHPRWILTASHCFDPDKAGSRLLKISVGANTPFFNHPAYSYEVKRVFRHWKYANHIDYDIGLVEMQTPIQFSAAVGAIALPKKEPEMSGFATLAGYGFVKTAPLTNPYSLQHVNLNIYDREACKRTQQPWPVTQRQLCTFNRQGQGICFGDSGSGLVRNGEIIGIASHLGSPNCAEGWPDVFTNVYAFVDWIRQITNYAV